MCKDTAEQEEVGRRESEEDRRKTTEGKEEDGKFEQVMGSKQERMRKMDDTIEENMVKSRISATNTQF